MENELGRDKVLEGAIPGRVGNELGGVRLRNALGSGWDIESPAVSPMVRSERFGEKLYQAWPESLAKTLVGGATGWAEKFPYVKPDETPREKGYRLAEEAGFVSMGIGKVGDWPSIKSAIDSIPRHKPGGLDLLTDLRAKFPDMPKGEFDEMMLKLSREGKISLHHHDMPGSYKGEMIKDGETYYHAFGVKPDWR